jgi:diguanylate cyclase (GGDEF)-like protein
MFTADTDAAAGRLKPSDAARHESLDAVFAKLLPTLLNQRAELLMVKDAVSGRYVHVNAAMASLLQRSAASLVGLCDTDVFDSLVSTNLRAADLAAQGAAEGTSSEHRFEWHGLRREFAVLRKVVEQGDRAVLCSVWRDLGAERLKDAQLRSALDQLEIEQRANESLRAEIKDQGQRDGRSGLYTRSHFEDQLRRETDLSVREHREFSLVLLDIDPWLEAVRQRGEPAKLRVVDALGRLLRSNTRAMDACCHLEGGRFAVLLSGVGLATAHGRMEQLRRQCATQIVMLDAQELHFSVSVGVASFPHTAHTREQLMMACEQAVAQARAKGNRVTLASIRLEEL